MSHRRRHELTDAQWEQVKDLLPGKESDPGRTAADNRLFVDAVIYVLKTIARPASLAPLIARRLPPIAHLPSVGMAVSNFPPIPAFPPAPATPLTAAVAATCICDAARTSFAAA